MVSIGLINPKSAVNVASILRACGCFGASSVFYTGERFNHAQKFNADTQKMREVIPTVGTDDILKMKAEGAVSIVVELVEGAIPLPQFEHPDNAYYIFGPEDGTVPVAVVEQCDHVVYIPTTNSLNLAATANVVLYDRLAKSNYVASDDLIRTSRDTNNNVKLKSV